MEMDFDEFLKRTGLEGKPGSLGHTPEDCETCPSKEECRLEQPEYLNKYNQWLDDGANNQNINDAKHEWSSTLAKMTAEAAASVGVPVKSLPDLRHYLEGLSRLTQRAFAMGFYCGRNYTPKEIKEREE
ncbi:hypothetical protein LCGC14_2542120 [marine sediment metagenome]|uniref:Uncharacterized protein n=1 Tax=marine sediment metagenome TaxID=412755 RepID=A0A0F9D1Z8_9ZZZZ